MGINEYLKKLNVKKIFYILVLTSIIYLVFNDTANRLAGALLYFAGWWHSKILKSKNTNVGSENGHIINH